MALKLVADKYYRGNGRWAKVVRLHKADANGNSTIPYWHVAFGVESQFVANSDDDFTTSRGAHRDAKLYIRMGRDE